MWAKNLLRQQNKKCYADEKIVSHELSTIEQTKTAFLTESIGLTESIRRKKREQLRREQLGNEREASNR